ncbi:MAG TPA: putative PEP-binding protein [Streptosporangiaceae bacterium]
MTVRYRGTAVSDGTAVGRVHLGGIGGFGDGAVAADEATVRAAFAAVARDRAGLAADLRARGEQVQAGIVEIGALIAADPALLDPALEAIRVGVDAITAVTRAADVQAAVLAALPDPDLAQRADDVRQVAAAVVGELSGAAAKPPPAGPFILVRREVDPAELIRLADSAVALVGAVSVGGGASSHAAIVARGLGLPMLAGADPRVLEAPDGHPAILDVAAGELIVDPVEPELAAVTAGEALASPLADGIVRTADGEQVTVLCNVASAAEAKLGLSAGAGGVGLLRTEIPFTGAAGWPTESEHLAQLAPILAELGGKPAIVRLLDFSGDKTPPFLAADAGGGFGGGLGAGGLGGGLGGGGAGRPRGLAALLGEPDALGSQLRAILRAGRGGPVAVLVPMVTSVDEVIQVRKRLAEVAGAAGSDPPELGIMVEVAATAAQAEAFGSLVDFFSIGTNDLTCDILGIDRADPRAGPALAADPRVLALVENVVRAGNEAGIKVSVCGDAAADPGVLPLLLGLGVRTISVGAASVPRVAQWITTTRIRIPDMP